jgi:hypothetical protein
VKAVQRAAMWRGGGSTAYSRSRYVLEHLPLDDAECRRVLRAARLVVPDDFDGPPLIVERVVNDAVRTRFDARVAATMAARGAHSVDAVVAPLMFHGTSAPALPLILAGGFDPSKNCTSAFGRGTYFGKTPDVSLRYSRCDEHGYNFMLVNAVVRGATCVGSSNAAIDTSRYDSAQSGDGTILVTPYADGAMTTHVIRYFGALPIAP